MYLYRKLLIGAMPPHIFAIADNAYNNIFHNKQIDQDQCIIFTGESGAGKTETVKFVLQYFSNMITSTGSETLCVEQQICDANFILEGFFFKKKCVMY